MLRSGLILLTFGLTLPALQADAVGDFIQKATAAHGAFGEKAARFLAEHMPEPDKKTLSADFLTENLDLAIKARESFPWAKQVPEEIFLNDVLPYAVFNETRDPWRADFLEKAGPLVKDCKSAAEAAQLLNKEFFKLINTHYDTKREKPNQSARESIAQGKASCTGLSIILVNACRAVGIPARAVGTPMWTNQRGNHTWVEVWDGKWHFTGADEYQAEGLDRGWFIKDAASAIAGHPMHAIYATSWKPRTRFPMVWSPQDPSVAAVDVTDRYAKPELQGPSLGIRLMAGKERLAKPGVILNGKNQVVATFLTKAGTADLNDMPQVSVTPGQDYRARFLIDGKVMESPTVKAKEGANTLDANVDDLKSTDLNARTADSWIRLIHQSILQTQIDQRQQELEERQIKAMEHSLRWLEITYGKAPADGRSLWISMHGGGQAPKQVNDQQWQNQIRLYQPEEGIYLAPRAPTDTWNMWHQDHIDPMFSRLIENMVALRGVNPDKIYLMGYSAGGDGVWQVAPRMADRFAAASMMAGHPNEAQLFGLRNLPFAILCGGKDSGFKRNEVCTRKAAEIEELAKQDPGGYTNFTRIYPEFGHWMNRKDAEAVPWMATYKRSAWPKKVIWYQDDVTHDRFYWIELPPGKAAKEQRIDATVDGQQITLKGEIPVGTRLLLHDQLLDLDQAVSVRINGQAPRSFNPKRSPEVIRKALEKRLDPASCPSAELILN